jgi:hypothetical protein
MAGPSIVVRVLGDVSGLAKSFGTAVSQGSSAAKGMHDAFSGVLSTLNQTGVLGPFGAALDNIDQAMQHVADHGKAIGPALMGVGGALAGIGVGLSALGSKDQAAHQQLQQAVEATGKSYDDYGGQVEKAIKSQESFGHTANQTQDALRVLTQATGDPAKALQLLNTASDLAAAKHEDLSTAATQLGKVYNGNTRLLKEFGISVTGAKNAQSGHNAVIELGTKLHGQAGAAASTFSGHMNALKAHVEDVAAAFGQKYGPAITAAGSVMAGLGAITTAGSGILDSFSTAQKGAAAATEAMSAAEDTATVSEGLALAPILLIVAALAALGVAAYLIYTNWTTIWGGIKAAVSAVFDWIQSNWPLLVGILLGPIGIAAYLIYHYWQDILNGIKAVWNWIASNWTLLLAILTGPIGLAIRWIVQNFAQLPRYIQQVLSDLVTILVWPFKTAFNLIASLWNDTVGSLSFHLPSWVPFIGGKGFSMPHIPTLAEGGLITQTGIVFAHAGEVISPAPATRNGPALVINEAHFSDAIDVELLMQRAAWAVQTQRI